MALPRGRQPGFGVRRLRAFGGVVALPIALGALFWYRADQGVIGSPVTQWTDLSGNGYHLTAAPAPSVATEPVVVANQLNGRQIVRFDGVGDRLQSPNMTFEVAKRYTLIVVSKQSGLPNATRQLWGAVGANGGINSFGQDDSDYWMYDGVFDRSLEAHAESDFELKIVRRHADAEHIFWRGLSLTGTRAHIDYTNPTGIPYHMGGLANDSFFWSGDVAEAIGFASSLSDADALALGAEVNTRWGL